MKAKQADYLREAAAFIALSGLLLCAPMTSRGEDVIDAAAAPKVATRAIMLPSLRVGGIPQGQVMQITERGGELVAAATITLAAATQATTIARAKIESKTAAGLFCAGSM